jgi:NADH:ubiquinone oxidoreductase subunit D
VRHEDPRGESMCFIMGTGGKNAYRVKFRSPAFVNISALPLLLLGYKIPDNPGIMGSIDVCIGEVDR